VAVLASVVVDEASRGVGVVVVEVVVVDVVVDGVVVVGVVVVDVVVVGVVVVVVGVVVSVVGSGAASLHEFSTRYCKTSLSCVKSDAKK